MCMCWSRNVPWKRGLTNFVSLLLDNLPVVSYVLPWCCTETQFPRFAPELLLCSHSPGNLWLAEMGILLSCRTWKLGSWVKLMWLFSFGAAHSQINLLSLISVEQWYWGKKTVVILFNSYWSPGLCLIFWKHHVSVFLKLNFTEFLFHRKLANLFYVYLKLHFKLLKISTEGESYYSTSLRSDFHLIVTEILSGCGWRRCDNHYTR